MENSLGVETYKASIERVAFRLNLEGREERDGFHPGALHPQPGCVLKHMVCV